MHALICNLFPLFCPDVRTFHNVYFFYHCFACFAKQKLTESNDSESATLEIMHHGRNEWRNRFIKFGVETIWFDVCVCFFALGR